MSDWFESIRTFDLATIFKSSGVYFLIFYLWSVIYFSLLWVVATALVETDLLSFFFLYSDLVNDLVKYESLWSSYESSEIVSKYDEIFN